MPITILQVFESRRLDAGLPPKNSYTEADFKEQSLAMIGGCYSCHATLAAYNAYPDTNGYWGCRDCIKEGYETVSNFEDDWGAPDNDNENNDEENAKPSAIVWPLAMSAHDFRELCDSYGGVCLNCQELKEYDCEPDMKNGPCDECGKRRVVGAEEALLMGKITFEE